jgi:hypothetical protein
MPLRVALDLAPLLGVPTGVARFTGELAERLAVRADVEIVGLAVVIDPESREIGMIRERGQATHPDRRRSILDGGADASRFPALDVLGPL